MRRYDAAVARERRFAGQLPELPEPRLQRVRKFAVTAHWRKRVRQLVVATIERHRLRPGKLGEVYLQTFANRIWSACWRTRGEPETRRERELKSVRDWFLGQNVVKPESVERVEQAVVQYFLGFERSVGLDRLPAEGERTAGAAQSADSSRADKKQRQRTYNTARSALIDQVCAESLPLLDELGVAVRSRSLYLGAVMQACSLVEQYPGGSVEFERQLEVYANQPERIRVGQDPDKVRRVMAFATERFDSLRRTLPPNPRRTSRSD